MPDASLPPELALTLEREAAEREAALGSQVRLYELALATSRAERVTAPRPAGIFACELCGVTLDAASDRCAAGWIERRVRDQLNSAHVSLAGLDYIAMACGTHAGDLGDLIAERAATQTAALEKATRPLSGESPIVYRPRLVNWPAVNGAL